MIILTFLGCRKNQRAVDNLSEESWEIVYGVDKTGALLYEDANSWSGKIFFESCKLRNQECEGRLELQSNVVTEFADERITQIVNEVWNFQYVVTTKGTDIQLTFLEKLIETTLTREMNNAVVSETVNTATESCEDRQEVKCSTDGTFDEDLGEVTLFTPSGAELVALRK
jgi:hypothetical protein